MKQKIYFLLLLFYGLTNAQDYSKVIKEHLTDNLTKTSLLEQDFSSVLISSESFSKSMNAMIVHASQLYNNIEVYNTSSSFAIRNNSVINASISFQSNLQAKVSHTTPTILPLTAINNAAIELGIQPESLKMISKKEGHFIFEKGNVSLENIPIKLIYQPVKNETLRLAWDFSILLKDTSHWYSIRVDAINGQLISKTDWMTNCNFNGAHIHSNELPKTDNFLFKKEELVKTESLANGTQYFVFAQPLRNPNEGGPTLEIAPENLNASPFGWHDVNGVEGADFTITRGNNVWVQEDQNGDNATGFSADGGAALNFNFTYQLTQQPGSFLEASMTNLFYWNNIIHDITYEYGFDEQSGNFQTNNYGNGGIDNDEVFADSQDGAGLNNANFGTPPDGMNPRMQMFLWNRGASQVNLFTLNQGPLSGPIDAMAASFGSIIPITPITEDLALIVDNDFGPSTDPNDGCDSIINGVDIHGKIAILRRGTCEFGTKALAAQNEGAVAVIIVNNQSGGGEFTANGGNDGGSVMIPVITLGQVNGDILITALQNGEVVNATILGQKLITGDLDAEVVVHEYAHGISTRLTGGANNSDCLITCIDVDSNGDCIQTSEQMGEGWSDYFALILTMKPTDQSTDIRGIATYSVRQGVNGGGIRPAPYSTDFNINPFTYQDTNGNVSPPHGIGFVWATMLWDMTWLLIDQYGFDEDIYNGTGGNNIALQLIMDGMKLQTCNPGFVDGRNAILEADMLANAGVNRCLIWEAFAKRGLGVSADQGDSLESSDQVENFDLPTDCLLNTNDTNFNNNFKIFPNPTDGNINIRSVVALTNATVSIFNINGSVVYSQELSIENQTIIDGSKLTPGVYLVKISGDSYIHTAKLIVK